MDCTFKTALGKFNYRVGLIIINGRRALMARNPNEKRMCYYSVGGRVSFGETLEQAALRELKEETGVDGELDRLACIHENFFTDAQGVLYHEISCFFTVKPNQKLFQIPDGFLTDKGPKGEYLKWVDLDGCGDTPVYPEFFKTVNFSADREFKHFITGN